MLRELSLRIIDQEELLAEEAQRELESHLPTFAGLSREAKQDLHRVLVEVLRHTLDFMINEGLDREELYAFARALGRRKVIQSIPFADLVRAIFIIERVVWDHIAPEAVGMDLEPRDWLRILEVQSELNSHVIAALSASYLEAKDEIISRQLRELHRLMEVGRTIMSTVDLEKVFLQILEVAIELMRTPMGAVYLLEKGGEELRLVAQVGLHHVWGEGRKVALERSLLNEAIRERAPVSAVDERLSGLSLPPPAMGGTVRSVLSCPILKDQVPIGGLELYDVEPRVYERVEMALLAAFAPQAGVAIENARLFHMERRRRYQLAVMKEMAEESASAVRFNHAVGIVTRKMAELAGVNRCLLFLYDPDSDQVEYVWGHGVSSAASERMRDVRWKPEEMDQLSRLALREGVPLFVEDTFTDPRVNAEHMRLFKIRSCLSVPLFYKGKVTGFLILGSSSKRPPFQEEELEMITAVASQAAVSVEQARLRKRVAEREKRLQELEAAERVFKERERSEAIIDANPQAIMVVDRDRLITVFNPAAGALFGWRREEAVGRHVHELLYGEENPPQGACTREGCPVDRAFRGERAEIKEMEYVRPDGTRIWISGTFSVIRNRRRQIESVVCVFRDITEEKRLQHLALVDKELDIASHIQGALLPDGPLDTDRVRVVAHQEQARIVGGDWYDYWIAGGKLYLVIGDAAGSGIPAALLSTLAMSAIRAEADSGSDLVEVLRKANRAIVPHRLEDRFVTVFLAELNLETLRLRYVNAGHNDPYLIRGGTEVIPLESARRAVLGAFDSPELEVTERVLERGDRIFLYTDGVVDCRDSKRRPFGERRLRRFLQQNGSRKGEALVRDLVKGLNDYSGGFVGDDFTIVLCDVKP
ncbi:MAG: SpoIIE family protein phosphatase [Candidatus Geothermincolales bacterium]